MSTCVDILGRVGVRVRVVLGGVGSGSRVVGCAVPVFPRVIFD